MKNERFMTLPFRMAALAAATGALVFGLAGCNGCNSAATSAPITNAANTGGADPADQNFASGAGQPTAVLGQSASYTPQQSGESYGNGQQAPAPIVNGQDQTYDYNQGYDDGTEQQQYIDAAQAPPELPEYDQPEAPDPNDIWTPGYWAYGNGGGYYWVPGAWVAAPYYGALWTPPYWGYYGGHYRFHHGYWGPHVGFYGGINYGFGYIGIGYFGGYWSGNSFYYNRYVNRVPGGWGGRVYDRPIVYNNVHYDARPNVRISYNGGRGGINVQPRPFEVAASRERHEGPLAPQVQAHNAAAQNRAQFFNENHGRPAVAAAPHAYGNAGAIRSTPQGVQVGRPAGNEGARNGQPQQGGAPAVRAGQPQGAANPGAHMSGPQQMGNAGVGNAGARNEQHVAPQNTHTTPQQVREQPQAVHQAQAPQQQTHQAPPQVHQQAPQQPFHAQPQVHEAPRAVQAAPQQHMEAPRAAAPAPQQHAAPAPQQHTAPAPQQHAAPAAAPHAEAPHAAPAGGGGREGHR